MAAALSPLTIGGVAKAVGVNLQTLRYQSDATLRTVISVKRAQERRFMLREVKELSDSAPQDCEAEMGCVQRCERKSRNSTHASSPRSVRFSLRCWFDAGGAGAATPPTHVTSEGRTS